MQVFKFFLLRETEGWWQMPRVPWGGGHFFCDQVASGLRCHLHGEMWWVLGFLAHEIPVLPSATQPCLHFSCQKLGQGELGEAVWCVCCGFVFLRVIRRLPDLSCLTSVSPPLMHALATLRKDASVSPVLRAAGNVLCSLILTATDSSGACC